MQNSVTQGGCVSKAGRIGEKDCAKGCEDKGMFTGKNGETVGDLYAPNKGDYATLKRQ